MPPIRPSVAAVRQRLRVWAVWAVSGMTLPCFALTVVLATTISATVSNPKLPVLVTSDTVPGTAEYVYTESGYVPMTGQ